MNQELLNGIVIALLAAGLASAGWLFRTSFRSYFKLSEEVKAIKTFLILTNKAFALTLHSPHTPYYDCLLVKFINNHGNLSEKEWDDLERITGEIEANLKNDREKRAIAGVTIATIRFIRGKPMPEPKAHIEETDKT